MHGKIWHLYDFPSYPGEKTSFGYFVWHEYSISSFLLEIIAMRASCKILELSERPPYTVWKCFQYQLQSDGWTASTSHWLLVLSAHPPPPPPPPPPPSVKWTNVEKSAPNHPGKPLHPHSPLHISRRGFPKLGRWFTNCSSATPPSSPVWERPWCQSQSASRPCWRPTSSPQPLPLASSRRDSIEATKEPHMRRKWFPANIEKQSRHLEPSALYQRWLSHKVVLLLKSSCHIAREGTLGQN